jgi:hypothetical protein
MPYYVFKVRPYARLEKLAEFVSFPEASSLAKSLRAAHAGEDRLLIKVMFAQNQEQAEDLLCQIREPRPAGDD